MADSHDNASDNFVHGEMDVHQQQHSFDLFVGMTKWGSLHLATVLVFVIILTCTKAGFFMALFAAIVVSVVGFFMLKKKPDAPH